MQGADFMRDTEHQARSVPARGRAALPAQHEKARRVN